MAKKENKKIPKYDILLDGEKINAKSICKDYTRTLAQKYLQKIKQPNAKITCINVDTQEQEIYNFVDYLLEKKAGGKRANAGRRKQELIQD